MRGTERTDGGAPPAGFRRRVAIPDHERRPGQNRADYLALHADAAAVNDANGPQAQLVRFVQVSFHYRLHVARGHAMQVEDICNGNGDRFIGIFKIVRHAISLYRRSALAAKYTHKQGQYLAYIYSYTKLHRQPPAELDMQMYFRVTPPSVHQMILTLEKRRLISRIPWTPRSIQVLVPEGELPKLD